MFQLDCWICFFVTFCHSRKIFTDHFVTASRLNSSLPSLLGFGKVLEQDGLQKKSSKRDLIFLHTNLYLKCFSQMQISNIHESIIIMKSIDTLFQKNRNTCFIGSKTTWLHLVVLNPIKHSCSLFKHYLNPTFPFLPNHSIAEKNVIICWPQIVKFIFGRQNSELWHLHTRVFLCAEFCIEEKQCP